MDVWILGGGVIDPGDSLWWLRLLCLLDPFILNNKIGLDHSSLSLSFIAFVLCVYIVSTNDDDGDGDDDLLEASVMLDRSTM